MLAFEEFTMLYQRRKGIHANVVTQLKCKYFRKEVKEINQSHPTPEGAV